MTLREVAARCPEGGILSGAGLCRIELGDRYPTLKTLEALAEVLALRVVVEPSGTRIERLEGRPFEGVDDAAGETGAEHRRRRGNVDPPIGEA